MTDSSDDGKSAATIWCSDCGVAMPDDAYARLYGRCARHADAEGTADRCERCRCGRLAEDDDGRNWKVMRGRRVCGTCVYELALAAAQGERWWTPAVSTPALNNGRG